MSGGAARGGTDSVEVRDSRVAKILNFPWRGRNADFRREEKIEGLATGGSRRSGESTASFSFWECDLA